MKYIWTKEQEDEDVASNICLVELTQNEILKYLNSMTTYLRFTMEYFTDYEDGYLPTLDFKIGVDEAGLPTFRFFEKPMKTNWVTPFDSATSLYNKITWTSNDLVRRLLRTEEDSIPEELPKIVNQYNYKLMWSGYPIEERTKIMESGIIDYRNRIKNLKRKRGKPYLQAHQTLEARLEKRLTEKSTWYKNWAKREEKKKIWGTRKGLRKKRLRD